MIITTGSSFLEILFDGFVILARDTLQAKSWSFSGYPVATTVVPASTINREFSSILSRSW